MQCAYISLETLAWIHKGALNLIHGLNLVHGLKWAWHTHALPLWASIIGPLFVYTTDHAESHSVSISVYGLDLTLKGPGGGGGGAESASTTFRVIKFFPRRASFHDFFLWSLAQLLVLFHTKKYFQSYATSCNQAYQNLKIFWICVRNVWKSLLVPKLHFEL